MAAQGGICGVCEGRKKRKSKATGCTSHEIEDQKERKRKREREKKAAYRKKKKGQKADAEDAVASMLSPELQQQQSCVVPTEATNHLRADQTHVTSSNTNPNH